MPTATARTFRDQDRGLLPREVSGELETRDVPTLGYTQYLVDGLPVDPDSLVYDLEVVEAEVVNTETTVPFGVDRWARAAATVAGGLLGRKALRLFDPDLEPTDNRYNPNQPRAKNGRWGSGGASAKSTKGATPKASKESRYKDASALVAKIKSGGGASSTSAASLPAALSGLTVKQLKGLAAEHGLRAGAGLKAKLVEKISTAIGGSDGRTGSGPSGTGRRVADPAGRPGDGGDGGSRGGDGKPPGGGAAGRVPAKLEAVNAKIDRFTGLLRSKGQHQTADWLDKLKGHVNGVGVEDALRGLDGAAPGGKRKEAHYEGGWDKDAFSPGEDGRHLAEFCEGYLNRHGVIMSHQLEAYSPVTPLVSSAAPAYGGSSKAPNRGSFLPKDSGLKNKLQESKSLPGLESSEDLGKLVGKKEGSPVTHLDDHVMSTLDAKYGKDKWIVKAYGDDAAAGYGIYFPQRAAQIKKDAQNAIWGAGENLSKYGFALRRDKAGVVKGLVHNSGDVYDFDTDKYARVIKGDARHWGDKAHAAAPHERGAALDGGGKEFMAQPAFNVVGVSDADRASGRTIAPGEGRTHVITRNGKAELVPHSTWVKGDPLPVVFENHDTRAMAQAAVDAINALPAKERRGQVYAPDIIKTTDGYRVVETNPANHTGSSGYLGNNPLVIDSYVSHLTGQQPAHVKFIQNLLTRRAPRGT